MNTDAAKSKKQPDSLPAENIVLHLDGQITKKRAADFKNIVYNDNKVSKVILNSSGGDEIAAIEIGEIIRHHNIEATVEGRCLSACFQYIFLQARKKIIEKDSIVAFHSNSKSANEWLRKSDIKINKNEITRNYYLKSFPVEHKLYSIKFPRKIMKYNNYGFWSLNPICFKKQSFKENVTYGVLFKKSASVPTSEMLYELGVITKGSWPKSKSELYKYRHHFENFCGVDMASKSLYFREAIIC